MLYINYKMYLVYKIIKEILITISTKFVSTKCI